ncbi:hypothetical protein D1007_37179 [Hordeum vulgare]|nr:hypothetical protein D1007_37179 [Hordeum vulgare]
MEKIVVGIRARMFVLAESMEQLQSAGASMIRPLWPDAVEPASMSRLSYWLAAGGDRLDAWRVSAARDGAYMALRLAEPWYRNLDLGKLVP